MPWAAAAAAASAVLPQEPSSEPCGTSFFCDTVPSFLPCGIGHAPVDGDRLLAVLALRPSRPCPRPYRSRVWAPRSGRRRSATAHAGSRRVSDVLPSPGAPVTRRHQGRHRAVDRCCPCDDWPARLLQPLRPGGRWGSSRRCRSHRLLGRCRRDRRGRRDLLWRIRRCQRGGVGVAGDRDACAARQPARDLRGRLVGDGLHDLRRDGRPGILARAGANSSPVTRWTRLPV